MPIRGFLNEGIDPESQYFMAPQTREAKFSPYFFKALENKVLK